MPTNLDAFATTGGALTALAAASGNTKAAAAIGTVTAVGSIIRKLNAGLSGGSELPLGQVKAPANWTDGTKDWRVKISLPTGNVSYLGGSMLDPLRASGNALIFPFTPQINMTHTASYNTLDPIHSNYPFLSYQNSKLEQISITGDFYCETSVDARYWVAVVHYLRSLTKMSFGNTSNAGQPPPVVKLNGYGDFVFKDVPIVVRSFTLDLPKEVDYISTGLGYNDELDGAIAADKIGYAPVKSTIQIVVSPVYSRTQVRKFTLDSFVRGDYILGNNSQVLGAPGFI
jgi:hypothetical protein